MRLPHRYLVNSLSDSRLLWAGLSAAMAVFCFAGFRATDAVSTATGQIDPDIPVDMPQPGPGSTPEEIYQQRELDIMRRPDGEDARQRVIKSENVPLATKYAWGLIRDNKLDEAKIWFGRIAKWDPRNPDAARGLGVIAQRTKALPPKTVPPVTNLGIASSPSLAPTNIPGAPVRQPEVFRPQTSVLPRTDMPSQRQMQPPEDQVNRQAPTRPITPIPGAPVTPRPVAPTSIPSYPTSTSPAPSYPATTYPGTSYPPTPSFPSAPGTVTPSVTPAPSSIPAYTRPETERMAPRTNATPAPVVSMPNQTPPSIPTQGTPVTSRTVRAVQPGDQVYDPTYTVPPSAPPATDPASVNSRRQATGKSISRARPTANMAAPVAAPVRPVVYAIDGDVEEDRVPPAPGTSYLAQAQQAQDEGRYDESIRLMQRAQTDARAQKAWYLFQQHKYDLAAEQFEALYRVDPTPDVAAGLYHSLKRSGQADRIPVLAQAWGGPLNDIYTRRLAKNYVDRGLAVAAYNLHPDNFPELQNVNSPNLTAGMGTRNKSGSPGTSYLRVVTLPSLNYNFFIGDKDEFNISVKFLEFDARSLPPFSQIGSAPINPPNPTVYRTTPTTAEGDLQQWTLSWRREGYTTFYGDLGFTPLTGEVGAMPVGHLGILQQEDDGYWAAELFGESVQESILSYTGIVDPWTSNAWGRVVRAGGRARGFIDLGCDFGFYGQGQADWLSGEQVMSNYHAGISAGISKNFKLPGFEWFSIGPTVSYDAYEKNLSHFTIGHGGYFSPQQLIQGVMALSFQTDEGKCYMLNGYLAMGAQKNRQDASDVLPYTPDGRVYEGESGSSFIFTGRIKGVRQIGEHWQIGGVLGYQKSASYNDLNAYGFIRYVFEPRTAVFSRDLPSDNP